MTPTSGKPVADGWYHRAVDHALVTAASTTPADQELVETSALCKRMCAMADDSTTIELTRSELASITCLIRVLAHRGSLPRRCDRERCR